MNTLEILENKKIVVFDLETLLWSSEVPGGFKNLPAFGVSIAHFFFPNAKDSNNAHIEYTPRLRSNHKNAQAHNQIREWLLSPEQKPIQRILDAADLIITFNGESFDFQVLKGVGFSVDGWKQKSFDILARFHEVAGHRISLDSLSSALLGKRKLLDGKKAVEYWRWGCSCLRMAEEMRNGEGGKMQLVYTDGGIVNPPRAHRFEQLGKAFVDCVRVYCREDVMLTWQIFLNIIENDYQVTYPSKGGTKTVRLRGID